MGRLMIFYMEGRSPACLAHLAHQAATQPHPLSFVLVGQGPAEGLENVMGLAGPGRAEDFENV